VIVIGDESFRLCIVRTKAQLSQLVYVCTVCRNLLTLFIRVKKYVKYQFQEMSHERRFRHFSESIPNRVRLGLFNRLHRFISAL